MTFPKPITFNVYKTNVGTFFQEATDSYYRVKPDSLKINSVELSNVPCVQGWFRIQGDITQVQQKMPAERTLVGFKLDNPKFASENIPLYLEAGVVEQHYDDDKDELVWNMYDEVRPLYSAVYETKESSWVDREFTLNVLGEYTVSDYRDIVSMKIQMKQPNYSFGDGVIEQELKDVVTYEQLEKLIVPEPLLHLRPCEITSEQVYKIIRQYIIVNLDRKVCRIKSNYDFCFSVEKFVGCEPYTAETYVSYGKRAKPKKVTFNKKEVQVFEMTHSGYKSGSDVQTGGGYKGYTVVKPWKANNLAEMQQQVQDYLQRLIDFLNAPAVECTHCKGAGIVDSLTKIER